MVNNRRSNHHREPSKPSTSPDTLSICGLRSADDARAYISRPTDPPPKTKKSLVPAPPFGEVNCGKARIMFRYDPIHKHRLKEGPRSGSVQAFHRKQVMQGVAACDGGEARTHQKSRASAEPARPTPPRKCVTGRTTECFPREFL